MKSTSADKKCLVIVENINQPNIYEGVLRPFLENELGYTCNRIGHDADHDLQPVVEAIFQTDLIISIDINNHSNMLLYQLGIAHSLNKKVLMIRKDDTSPDSIPEGLEGYMFAYSTEFFQIDRLKREIKSLIQGKKPFRNPVKEALSSEDILVSNKELLKLKKELEELKEENAKLQKRVTFAGGLVEGIRAATKGLGKGIDSEEFIDLLMNEVEKGEEVTINIPSSSSSKRNRIKFKPIPPEKGA